MLMTYVGALKSWIYSPVFRALGNSIVVLRAPMLLAATLSIWLFYLFLRRVAGYRAALIGCGLLAVDSIYLLTSAFDWGPVALQHLLLLGGMYLLVRFYQEGSDAALAGGFFLFGLALWDKALAVWLLSGIGIAALLTLPRQILGVATRRRVAISGAAFCVGALPLLIYNAGHHWVTFRGNFKPETQYIGLKARALYITPDGSGLFGWMLREDWNTPRPHQPATALEKTSAAISALAGHPRHNLTRWCMLLGLLLIPLARGRDLRAILFALIALVVAWVQIAITAGAGASAHHTILLWPLPFMVVAIALAPASRRLGRAGIPAVAVVLAVCMIAGALVTNEYYTVMRRDGGGQSWTEAIFPLADYLKKDPSKPVMCMDWGMLESLRFLGRGKLALFIGSDEVMQPEMSEDARASALRMISGPDNVFVGHTKRFEFFKDTTPKLVKLASEAGYRREDLALIWDHYGRPVFEIYRFRPAAATSLTAQR